jgi:hypothetical protein
LDALALSLVEISFADNHKSGGNDVPVIFQMAEQAPSRTGRLRRLMAPAGK